MRMCACADPDNWAIDSWEFDWVNANVIRDRAQNIAHAANKPFIIEETGMKVPPTPSEAPPCAVFVQGGLCTPIFSQVASQQGSSSRCVYLSGHDLDVG